MDRTSFINVDLELSSIEDLSLIANGLGERIFLLQNGYENNEYILNFECSLGEKEPAAVIEKLLDLIKSLDTEGKCLLANCYKRVLDLGYDSGDENMVYNNIPNALLKRVVANGFSISISVYPLDQEGIEENS